MRHFLHAPGSLPPKILFPQTEDMRPPAGGVRGHISSSSRNRGLQGSPYHPAWDRGADYSPNVTPSRLYRPAWEEIIALVAPSRGLGADLEATSSPNIVLPGKPHRLLSEISHLDLIVLPGKSYRPCQETLSSCPGTNIVLPGNLYRPLREPISSCRGKVIVLLRK